MHTISQKFANVTTPAEDPSYGFIKKDKFCKRHCGSFIEHVDKRVEGKSHDFFF